MKVYRKSIGIIPDNEEKYFSLLSAVVESVDDLSIMVIMKNPRNYHFKINPSLSTYIPRIIGEINRLNNLCGIKVDYSKSIKNSSTIDFTVNF